MFFLINVPLHIGRYLVAEFGESLILVVWGGVALLKQFLLQGVCDFAAKVCLVFLRFFFRDYAFAYFIGNGCHLERLESFLVKIIGQSVCLQRIHLFD
jgi:hypothetical protein